ncbi:MAG: hypothetical protein IKR76_05980 [Ruminococcus sp.]|nr:hypothetical protein [Ruminococcus sp.]
MITDKITVTGDLKGKEQALAAAEKFCDYNGITGKSAMYVRLLTEEAIGMIHGIMDNFSGELWLESEKAESGLICRVHLKNPKGATESQENKLLSVSSTGRNESAKGIIGKIRELIRIGTQNTDLASENAGLGTLDNWVSMGLPHGEARFIDDYYVGYWSLVNYRDSVETSPKDETSKEAYDELERSIIAKLSDDVKVWLRSDYTEVVIEKQLLS